MLTGRLRKPTLALVVAAVSLWFAVDAARSQSPTVDVLDVPVRFVAAVNAASSDAGACEWMVLDWRELLQYPELLGLDPRRADTWTPENKLRSCNTVVAVYNGYIEDAGPPEWVRTEISDVVQVETRDTLVHARARVRHVFRTREDDTDTSVDFYLEREDGQWRLASLAGLLYLAGDERLASFAEFDAYRIKIGAEAAEVRAQEQKLMRDYEAARRPIATQPLPCAGRSSARRDRRGDVRWNDGDHLVRDQRVVHNDLISARLRTRGGRLCWELRFRTAVAAEVGVEFTLLQGGDRHRSPLASDWDLELSEGRVYASRDVGDGRFQPVPVRASVVGRVVRVSVRARDLHARGIDFRRPFRWNATSWERNPDGGPGSWGWLDRLPDDQQVVPGNGILHRPTASASSR